MEENENVKLWDKTTAELTVKDQLIVAAVSPIIVMGGFAVAFAAAGAVSKVGEKIRNRRKPVLTVVEETD